jgi:predicted flap endonuclease-1-like 5' DNA nuclease
MARIIQIEGIGPVYAQKLREAGIRTSDALLEAGGTRNGRKKLAEAAGIDETLILEWVNHADLYRIKGVAEEYSDLLEEAGVDTVPELAQRNPQNLYEKMQAVNEEKELVRRLPSQRQVVDWVEQAKALPRAIEY